LYCPAPWGGYRTRGMPILAWSSLALGFFASDHRPLAELSESEVRRILSNRWSADVARVFYSDRNFERRRRTLALAKEKGVSATELALAWLLKQPLRIAVVVGPRSAEEVRSLFQALEISLSGTEMDWLEFAGHSSLASNG